MGPFKLTMSSPSTGEFQTGLVSYLTYTLSLPLRKHTDAIFSTLEAANLAVKLKSWVVFCFLLVYFSMLLAPWVTIVQENHHLVFKGLRCHGAFVLPKALVL